MDRRTWAVLFGWGRTKLGRDGEGESILGICLIKEREKRRCNERLAHKEKEKEKLEGTARRKGQRLLWEKVKKKGAKVGFSRTY